MTAQTILAREKRDRKGRGRRGSRPRGPKPGFPPKPSSPPRNGESKPVGPLAELRDWELETGRPLPYTPQQIERLEAAGHVVDLVTGEILLGGADLAPYEPADVETLLAALRVEEGEVQP